MALQGSFRSRFQEINISGYVLATGSETGAAVIKSYKGPDYPIKLTTEDDVYKYFGYPSAEYPDLFEIVSFVKQAPIWVGAAIGDNATYGGVDVTSSSVVGFGGGRVKPANFNYTSASQKTSHNAGTGDGIEDDFSGSITNTPVVDGSLKVKVGNTYVSMTDAAGVISGDDIDSGGTNTIVYATGAYDFRLDGTPGTVASLTGNVAQNFNLQTNKYVNLTIDGVLYENLNLSTGAADPSAVTAAEVVSAINTVVGTTQASVSTDYVKIVGNIGSASYGNVKVEAPTLGASALSTVFSSGGGTVEALGTDPTGAIPKYGQSVTIEYSYTADLSTTVSHSFFALSPYTDDLSVEISNISGQQFNLILYQDLNGQSVQIREYDYSLIREKNTSGKQLYILDVFDDDPYLVAKVNSSYTGSTPSLTATEVDLNGGDRGDEPGSSDYTAIWDYFKKPNTYYAKIFMDIHGQTGIASYINNIIVNYQWWAHGISIVPMDNDSDDSITYRSGLGIDSDKVSLYTNWRKIYDLYNDSFAWISNVGSIGKKYAQMESVYDGKSPAGIDENGLGGQISDYTTVEMEFDYDDTMLKAMDQAQVNPVIYDDTYGVMIYGDKTLKANLQDTSFIHTRRIYNLIIETVVKQILRLQEFKNNDEFHRLKAQSMAENFLQPILSQNLLRNAVVICDERNNTDLVLEQRQFALDIVVKATPNSQQTTLSLTQAGQSTDIQELIGNIFG